MENCKSGDGTLVSTLKNSERKNQVEIKLNKIMGSCDKILITINSLDNLLNYVKENKPNGEKQLVSEASSIPVLSQIIEIQNKLDVIENRLRIFIDDIII